MSSPCSTPGCFKASETLLGIETDSFNQDDGVGSGFKASETLLGIETPLQEFADL